jgi:predicted O-methyltransferase YrrM/predicted  nucleic acid-binding Zn-ribbon protein
MSALVASWTRAHSGEPCTVLEIGSWTGGSAITWAKALDEVGAPGQVVCIDKWEVAFDAAANAAEVYKEMTRAAASGDAEKLFWHNIRAAGVENRIALLRGFSQDILPLLESRRFSIVFVDGSHFYKDVLHDIGHAIRLVQDRGIVCGDDLEVQRHDCSEKTLRDGIANDADYQLDDRTGQWYHPGVTAAVGELLGLVSVWEGFWAIERRGDMWQQVQLTDVRDELPLHLRSSDVEPVLVAEGISGYNIVKAGDAYIGIPSSLGPLRIDDDSSLVAAMNATIIGTSADAVKEQIAARRPDDSAADQSSRSPESSGPPVLVVEGYKGFNVLAYRGRYYALAQALGPVRLDGPEFATFVPRGLAAVSDSEAATRRMVDDISARPAAASNSSVPTGHIHVPDSELQSLLTNVSQEIGSIASAVNAMANAIGASAARMASREHEVARISSLEKELAEGRAALNQAVAARDQAIAESASAAAEYERVATELASAAAERDRLVALHSACAPTLSNRTQELAAARQQIASLTAAQAAAHKQRDTDVRKLRAALQRIRELKRRVKAGENARHVLEAEGQELLAWVHRLHEEFVSGDRS